MQKRGRITSVSLGPGDPELITVKALRQLREADLVYYPGTVDASGVVIGIAYDILMKCDLDASRLRGIYVPMSRSRGAAEECYDEAYASMRAAVAEGLDVTVVSVGDGGFYSTASAIVERALADGLDCSMTPGIPAFIAAGSAARLPLSLHDDSVAVLAQIESLDELDSALAMHDTVVVMKLSTVRDEVFAFLERNGKPFLYAEKIGMAGEFLATDTEALRGRTIPYFSLLVCSRRWSNDKS
ncbi:precorrin-2 C(20)-methyltransferase [Chlorobium sp. N1]|nr:precorrin-2 C(20)-methyltransferase [Chlorobium sp. N1]